MSSIARRFSGAILVLVAVSAVVFFAGRALAPGNAATTIIGSEGATVQQRVALEHRLGLDEPLVSQYGTWLDGVVHGDFGASPISGRSATNTIAQEAPVSVELALLGLIVATIIGVPLGILAAIRANRTADRVARGITLTALSVPVFVTGTLLVLAAARWIPGLYSASYVSFFKNPAANLRGMVLPVVTVAVPTAALLMQMTRGTMLDQLNQPFMAAARARGIAPRNLYVIHALKSAMSPLLTFQGFQFGILLGSSFIVEVVFSLPGIGRGLIADIQNRDFVLVEAEVLVVAAAFVLGNLVVDIADSMLDPRKRRHAG